MKPYKSAILLWKAVHLNCPNELICIFCEYQEFCKAMLNAYEEAKKILPKEMITYLEKEKREIKTMAKEIGCSRCPYAGHIELKECPDAYTEVSQYCGLYEHEPIEKEGADNEQ